MLVRLQGIMVEFRDSMLQRLQGASFDIDVKLLLLLLLLFWGMLVLMVWVFSTCGKGGRVLRNGG
jgi:hypothetical protein